jgi:hypothetical protein
MYTFMVWSYGKLITKFGLSMCDTVGMDMQHDIASKILN